MTLTNDITQKAKIRGELVVQHLHQRVHFHLFRASCHATKGSGLVTDLEHPARGVVAGAIRLSRSIPLKAGEEGVDGVQVDCWDCRNHTRHSPRRNRRIDNRVLKTKVAEEALWSEDELCIRSTGDRLLLDLIPSEDGESLVDALQNRNCFPIHFCSLHRGAYPTGLRPCLGQHLPRRFLGLLFPWPPRLPHDLRSLDQPTDE